MIAGDPFAYWLMKETPLLFEWWGYCFGGHLYDELCYALYGDWSV